MLDWAIPESEICLIDDTNHKEDKIINVVNQNSSKGISIEPQSLRNGRKYDKYWKKETWFIEKVLSSRFGEEARSIFAGNNEGSYTERSEKIYSTVISAVEEEHHRDYNKKCSNLILNDFSKLKSSKDKTNILASSFMLDDMIDMLFFKAKFCAEILLEKQLYRANRMTYSYCKPMGIAIDQIAYEIRKNLEIFMRGTVILRKFIDAFRIESKECVAKCHSMAKLLNSICNPIEFTMDLEQESSIELDQYVDADQEASQLFSSASSIANDSDSSSFLNVPHGGVVCVEENEFSHISKEEKPNDNRSQVATLAPNFTLPLSSSSHSNDLSLEERQANYEIEEQKRRQAKVREDFLNRKPGKKPTAPKMKAAAQPSGFQWFSELKFIEKTHISTLERQIEKMQKELERAKESLLSPEEREKLRVERAQKKAEQEAEKWKKVHQVHARKILVRLFNRIVLIKRMKRRLYNRLVTRIQRFYRFFIIFKRLRRLIVRKKREKFALNVVRKFLMSSKFGLRRRRVACRRIQCWFRQCRMQRLYRLVIQATRQSSISQSLEKYVDCFAALQNRVDRMEKVLNLITPQHVAEAVQTKFPEFKKEIIELSSSNQQQYSKPQQVISRIHELANQLDLKLTSLENIGDNIWMSVSSSLRNESLNTQDPLYRTSTESHSKPNQSMEIKVEEIMDDELEDELVDDRHSNRNQDNNDDENCSAVKENQSVNKRHHREKILDKVKRVEASSNNFLQALDDFDQWRLKERNIRLEDDHSYQDRCRRPLSTPLEPTPATSSSSSSSPPQLKMEYKESNPCDDNINEDTKKMESGMSWREILPLMFDSLNDRKTPLEGGYQEHREYFHVHLFRRALSIRDSLQQLQNIRLHDDTIDDGKLQLERSSYIQEAERVKNLAFSVSMSNHFLISSKEFDRLWNQEVLSWMELKELIAPMFQQLAYRLDCMPYSWRDYLRSNEYSRVPSIGMISALFYSAQFESKSEKFTTSKSKIFHHYFQYLDDGMLDCLQRMKNPSYSWGNLPTTISLRHASILRPSIACVDSSHLISLQLSLAHLGQIFPTFCVKYNGMTNRSKSIDPPPEQVGDWRDYEHQETVMKTVEMAGVGSLRFSCVSLFKDYFQSLSSSLTNNSLDANGLLWQVISSIGSSSLQKDLNEVIYGSDVSASGCQDNNNNNNNVEYSQPRVPRLASSSTHAGCFSIKLMQSIMNAEQYDPRSGIDGDVLFFVLYWLNRISSFLCHSNSNHSNNNNKSSFQSESLCPEYLSGMEAIQLLQHVLWGVESPEQQGLPLLSWIVGGLSLLSLEHLSLIRTTLRLVGLDYSPIAWENVKQREQWRKLEIESWSKKASLTNPTINLPSKPYSSDASKIPRPPDRSLLSSAQEYSSRSVNNSNSSNSSNNNRKQSTAPSQQPRLRKTTMNRPGVTYSVESRGFDSEIPTSTTGESSTARWAAVDQHLREFPSFQKYFQVVDFDKYQYQVFYESRPSIDTNHPSAAMASVPDMNARSFSKISIFTDGLTALKENKKDSVFLFHPEMNLPVQQNGVGMIRESILGSNRDRAQDITMEMNVLPPRLELEHEDSYISTSTIEQPSKNNNPEFLSLHALHEIGLEPSISSRKDKSSYWVEKSLIYVEKYLHRCQISVWDFIFALLPFHLEQGQWIEQSMLWNQLFRRIDLQNVGEIDQASFVRFILHVAHKNHEFSAIKRRSNLHSYAQPGEDISSFANLISEQYQRSLLKWNLRMMNFVAFQDCLISLLQAQYISLQDIEMYM